MRHPSSSAGRGPALLLPSLLAIVTACAPGASPEDGDAGSATSALDGGALDAALDPVPHDSDGGEDDGGHGDDDDDDNDDGADAGPSDPSDGDRSDDGTIDDDAGEAPLDAGLPLPDAGPAQPDAGPAQPDAGPPPPSGPLLLYVSTTGDDANDGSSPTSAVLTLARVHAILVDTQPERDVHVRIAPGTYRGQRVTWTFTMPDHVIRFRTSSPDNVRPIFDGCLANGSCPGGTWFILSSSSGEATNLHFEYLRVTRYQTAISLNGSRAQRSTSNGHNRLFGMYFDRIGNGYNPALNYSTAAVRLVNSDDNTIRNNHFVDVINTSSGGLIHGIYAAHGSERNAIEKNRFLRSTGDPVRIRDYSNGNVVRENRFIRVGTNAGYTDWYCDHEVNTACTSPNPECPSWDNQFRDNELDGTWSCSTLGVWELFQDDSTTGCTPPTATSQRVRTSGNTQSAAPCSGD